MVDTSVLRDISKRSLEAILDKIAGPKTLVLDARLTGAVNLVTDMESLRAHSVGRIVTLEPGLVGDAERNVVYLAKPDAGVLHTIADQVKSSSRQNVHFHLLAVPRMPATAAIFLQDLGLKGSVDVQDFQMGFIVHEPDVLSLETDLVWRQRTVEGDVSAMYDYARALLTVQRALGRPRRTLGQGHAAKLVIELAERLDQEAAPGSFANAGALETMIVLDRQVDMVTPMCTQLTYAGLVDELVGIKNFHLEHSVASSTPPATPSTSGSSDKRQTRREKRHLNGADPVYAQLRDNNFANVRTILHALSVRSKGFEDSVQREGRDLAELRKVAGRLSAYEVEKESLGFHIRLTQRLEGVFNSEHFEKVVRIQQNLVAGEEVAAQEVSLRLLLNSHAPMMEVLRLLCLHTLTTGGFQSRTYDDIRRDFLQAYGFEHAKLLVTLEHARLFTKATGRKTAFDAARGALSLVVVGVNEREPDDVAYVFSGYAPLAVRLVQRALEDKGDWRSIEGVLAHLGPTVERGARDVPAEAPNGRASVVCFVGGVTYAEIAAIRFLSRALRRRIVILTDSIAQGTRLLESLT